MTTEILTEAATVLALITFGGAIGAIVTATATALGAPPFVGGALSGASVALVLVAAMPRFHDD